MRETELLEVCGWCGQEVNHMDLWNRQEEHCPKCQWVGSKGLLPCDCGYADVPIQLP